MAIMRKALFFLFLVVTTISCSPEEAHQAVILTQTPESLESPTHDPNLEPDVNQPAQVLQGVVELRTLLGTERGEVATSVIELEDGGFMIAGYDYDKLQNISEWDALVMRISPDGQQVWRQSTDRPGSEYAWVVRETPDGHFVIVGTRETENGDTDGYMQCIDADGNEIWLRTYGGDEDELLWAAEPVPDGGFLLAGQTNSEGAGDFDFYLIRTDKDGYEIWSEAFGTPVIDRAFGIGLSPDGGALVAGFTGDNARTMNLFFIRINSDGHKLWQRRIAGDRFDVAHDVLSLGDDGFAISGYTSSFSPGDHDGFLMRFSADGRMLWMKTYGDTGDDRILHVVMLEDGGYALVGYSNWDLVVRRVDSRGNLLWSYRDEGKLEDVGKDIVVTHSGSIVAVGGNRSENPPLDDIILLILSEEVIS